MQIHTPENYQHWIDFFNESFRSLQQVG